MRDRAGNLLDALLGPLLGLAALLLYGLTLSRGAYPGESAYQLVQTLGLMPVLAPAHPLWRTLAALTRALAGQRAVGALNGLSALCAAAAVWLLYEVVARAVRLCVAADPDKAGAERTAARLAGAAAAVFLASAVPFWTVANRAHPAPFAVAWLLGVTLLLVRYVESGRWRWAWLFAAGYGLGVAEFATFIILAPLFGVLLLAALWRREELRAPRLLTLLPAAVGAALLLYLLMAWQFCGSRGYVWRGYSGFWHVLWIVWRDQVFLITRSLPQRGWLVILVVTVLPWLTALIVARRALNEERDWTYYLLHLILAAPAIGLLLNFRLAPWPMLGAARLLVTPYVLAATLYGYLAAYAFLLPLGWWRPDDEGWRAWCRRRLGWLLCLPLLALLPVAARRNLPQADARPAGIVNRYAAQVVEHLGRRSWLVSDGSLDPHLRLAAWRAGKPLRLINVNAGNSAVYLRYVAELFEAPRYRNLAQIGMLPLLSEWFASDPAVLQDAALMVLPELWTAAGATAVPFKTIFWGATDRRALRPDELLAVHESFWAETVPELRRLTAREADLARLGTHLLERCSLAANNLGVLLEDLNAPAQAYRAYRMACELNTNNLSALLNLETMIQNGWPSEQAAAIHRDLTNAVETYGLRKGHLWALARQFGFVRSPDAFARAGWTWALSGRPGLAVRELQKAVELAPDDSKDAFRRLLAGAYLADAREEQGEAIYRDLLARDPRNLGALLGLFRLALRRGDFAQAEERLRQAAAAGLKRPALEMQEALLLAARGEPAASRARLEAVLQRQPEFTDARILLSALLLEQGDDDALAESLRRLREQPGGRGFAAALEAERALRRNDWPAAREALEEAAKHLPRQPQILERLLQLDLRQNLTDEAAAHARQLLALDVNHAQANYVLGHVQLLAQEYDLAEDSLRRSLRAARTPRALNDLAWLLVEKSQWSEAEKLAREALALQPGLAAAHDTLGVVLMKTQRFEEAQRCFEQALTLRPDEPSILLHLAELLARQGNAARARELVDVLHEKIDRLTPADREQLGAVSRLVDAARR